MITTDVLGFQSSITGLVTDIKPIDGIVNGSIFKELDPTNKSLKVYIFDGENKQWVEI